MLTPKQSYYQRNKERIRPIVAAKMREYRESLGKDEVRARVRAQVATWRKANRERNLASSRTAHRSYRVRTKFSLQHRLSRRVTTILSFALRNKRPAGLCVMELATGLSRKQLPEHFKVQTGYSIDHIVPMSAFDMSDPIQFLKANHLSNLRYVTLSENCSKGPKVAEGFNIDIMPYHDSPMALEKVTEFIERERRKCLAGSAIRPSTSTHASAVATC